MKQLPDGKHEYIQSLLFVRNMGGGNAALHHLTVKHTGVVELEQSTGEFFFVLLEIAAIAGARVC